MQIRCKFGQLGQGRGQFNAPHGFCLGGRDEEIVVADTHNHRIQVANLKSMFQILIERYTKLHNNSITFYNYMILGIRQKR